MAEDTCRKKPNLTDPGKSEEQSNQVPYKEPAEDSKFYGLESHFNEDVVFYKDVRIHGELKANFSFLKNISLTAKSLHVLGNSIFDGDSYFENINAGIVTARDGLNVGCGGTTLKAVVSTGNVGIGSTIPQQRVDVAGSIKIDESIYDSVNRPGKNGYDLVRDQKGLRWIPQVAESNLGPCDSSSIGIATDGIFILSGGVPLYPEYVPLKTCEFGNIRLNGTIYDGSNQPGTTGQILAKNSLGSLTWINQGSISAGAGGAYRSIQFHNSTDTLGGATDFVYDEVNSRVGIGSTIPTTKLDILGNTKIVGILTVGSNSITIDGNTDKIKVGSGITIEGTGNASYTGIITAIKFVGDVTGTATTAAKLQTAKNFSITGNFVTASAVSFDGTNNVALAATIVPDSIGLGTYTYGDYVQTISGTSNQIAVTGGTGESSTPILSIPNQFTAPQDVTVSRDLLVSRNLNVNGSITIGGTSATLYTTELKVADPDLILGIRTDGNGNDVSTDNTANHGGIAIASTEGNPLVRLYNPGIGESTLPTYKKIMWFKAGAFAGLGTDAWLINYGVGIGSTQFPSGTRLAVDNIQFTENDLSVVRNINSSGIITSNSLSIGPNQVISSSRQLQNIASLDATTTATIESAIQNSPNVFTDLQVTGVSTFTNGPVLIGSATSTGTASQRLQVTGGAYVSGNLGIGTINPTHKLQVLGTSVAAYFNFQAGSDLSGYGGFANSAGTTLGYLGNGGGGALTAGANTDFVLRAEANLLFASGGNTQRLILTNTGNFGVGVANPTDKLQVSGTDQNITANESGTSTAWRARILSKNSLADKASFLGVYASVPGVFAHNHALNAWADLYVNTTNGSDGGNVYIAGGGNVAIGGNNASYKLDVSGSIRSTGQLISTQANNTADGGAQIYLNGATGNRIDFNTNGVAAPSYTTRSAGTKIVLYPAMSASSSDFAFGIESSTLWSSVPSSAYQFKWYAGTTNIATLSGGGNFTATSFSGTTETLSGNISAWDGTTPGLGVGGLHLGNSSGTSNAGPAITFGSRDSSSGTTAQAGIYINSGSGYGTRMYFATTDSYATGSKVAMQIDEGGNVYFPRGGTLSVATNGSTLYGPNSGWGEYLRVGGNGNADATNASVVATNGNLHLDAKTGGFVTYLNYYKGTGGVAFGNGASGAVAWMGPDGDLWKGGADNTGSPYWHAGNDGSGSGLDADLLDGKNIGTSGNVVPLMDGSNTWSGTQYFPGNFTAEAQTKADITTRTSSGFFQDGGSATTAEGWPVTSNNWYHLLCSTHSNTANYYSMQFAADFYSNSLFYRSTNGNGATGWDRVVLYGNNYASTVYGTIFYDSNDTGYYCDPASTSRFNAITPNVINSPYSGGNSGLTRSSYPYSFGFQEGGAWTSPYPDLILQYYTGVTLAANNGYDGITFKADYNNDTVIFRVNGGSNYLYKYYWMYTNTTGMYSDTNSAHIYPNGGSTYTQWRIDGNRNGYGGIWDSYSAVNGFMYDSSGNGGVYREANGRWYLYHNIANVCMGVNASTTSSSYGMYVTGGIYSTGNVVAYSDIRKKTEIKTISNALDKVNQLRGVTYRRIDYEENDVRNGAIEMGVIAQEVEPVVPEVVTYAKDIDEYGVSYGNFAGLFIEAFKEQNQIINNLKLEIENLKKKLEN